MSTSQAMLVSREPARQALAVEAARLRADAESRYGEVDLLVVTLRDHIQDLKIERNRLLTELSRLRDDARRNSSPWLARGSKTNWQTGPQPS